MKFSVVCLIFIALPLLQEVESRCGCRVGYRAIGCYKDGSDRTLPQLLITERDRSMKAYNGYDIDWYNWDEYVPAFTCRCAEAAMKKGYKIFGLQFWGECWSGPSPAAAERYNKYGKASNCYGQGYKKCELNSMDNNCVGDHLHNFVYEIEVYDCPVKFDRLGCYNLFHGRNIWLAELTDRDTSHPDTSHPLSRSGRTIDWLNYDIYLPGFACRCAQKASKKGYNTFGLQYYGECWSGPDDDTYFKDGASSSCLNQCYKQCRSYNAFCTGRYSANFVYRITKNVCEIEHEALRCYNEDTKQRALPELILDDVNPQSSKFTGMVSTNFKDWEKYMQGLVCRCARKIKEKGYTTFSIVNGGECWSGPNAQKTFAKHGSSDVCYFDQTTPCNLTTCAGGKNTGFVYKLI